jgi:hypothetical protein
MKKILYKRLLKTLSTQILKDDLGSCKLLLLFPGLAWVLFCSSSLAKTRYPPGATPGSVACQPDNGSLGGSQTVVRKTGYWQNTWGAIADSKNGMGGVTVGNASKREALEAAVMACESRRGIECKATFSYYNQCVAIAQPTKNLNGSFSLKEVLRRELWQF